MDIETYYEAHQGLKDFTSTLMDLVIAELTNIDKDYNCKKQFYLTPYARDLANLLDVEIKMNYTLRVLSELEKLAILKINNELNKKETDLSKIREMIDPIIDFYQSHLGLDDEVKEDLSTATNKNIKETLAFLVQDMREMDEHFLSSKDLDLILEDDIKEFNETTSKKEVRPQNNFTEEDYEKLKEFFRNMKGEVDGDN